MMLLDPNLIVRVIGKGKYWELGLETNWKLMMSFQSLCSQQIYYCILLQLRSVSRLQRESHMEGIAVVEPGSEQKPNNWARFGAMWCFGTTFCWASAQREMSAQECANRVMRVFCFDCKMWRLHHKEPCCNYLGGRGLQDTGCSLRCQMFPPLAKKESIRRQKRKSFRNYCFDI